MAVGFAGDAITCTGPVAHARRFRGQVRLGGGDVRPGQRKTATGRGRNRPRAVPGLRLQRRVRLRRHAARTADRVPRRLCIFVPAARRFAGQRPAVQAGRCQRRQRLVGEPAALRVSCAVDAGGLQAAPYQPRLGAGAEPGPAAQPEAGVHDLQQRRRQGLGVLRQPGVRATGAGRRFTAAGHGDRSAGQQRRARRRWRSCDRVARAIPRRGRVGVAARPGPDARVRRPEPAMGGGPRLGLRDRAVRRRPAMARGAAGAGRQRRPRCDRVARIRRPVYPRAAVGRPARAVWPGAGNGGAVGIRRDAERLRQINRPARAARPLPARLHRRAAVLDRRRHRRRRRPGPDRRGRRGRGRTGRGQHRAVRAHRRQAGHLGRRAGLADAAGRLPADPERRLAAPGFRAGDHRVRRRHARALATVGALRVDQHHRHPARLHAGAGRAALAGQSADAVPEHHRRGQRDRGAALRAGRRSPRNPRGALGGQWRAHGGAVAAADQRVHQHLRWRLGGRSPRRGRPPSSPARDGPERTGVRRRAVHGATGAGRNLCTRLARAAERGPRRTRRVPRRCAGAAAAGRCAVAPQARQRAAARAAPGPEARRHAAHRAGAHADQPQGPAPAAGHALVCAGVDPRRRDDRRRAAAHGPQ